MTFGRGPNSPYAHDRAEIRRVLETEGLAAARMRFGDNPVMPIAQVMGLTSHYRHVGDHAWKPEWNRLLGTKPDSVLAGELNWPVVSVGLARRKLGIPPFSRSQHKAEKAARITALLVSMSDALLMRNLAVIRFETGAYPKQIHQERQRRGLDYRYKRSYRPVSLSDLRRVCVLSMRAAYPEVQLQEMGAVLGISRERVRQYEEEQRHAEQAVSA